MNSQHIPHFLEVRSWYDLVTSSEPNALKQISGFQLTQLIKFSLNKRFGVQTLPTS